MSAKALIVLAALVGTIGGRAGAAANGKTRVLCYTTFDEDYFYLAAVVQKPNLAGTQSTPFSDPLSDDAVAVFLQTEDTPVGAGRSPRSVEMAVSAAGGAQLYRGADAAPLKGFQDFLALPSGARLPFKYGVTVRGVLNQPGGDNTGYTVEMAIPWAEIGGRPDIGARLRFNVVAYSAAAGSPPILSMSPTVKAPADVQNPSLWGEIVLVESPVKTVAAAPNARVCARVFTSKPLVDGVISSGEWNAVTSFGFEATASGGTTAVSAAMGTARIPPALNLRPPRPVVVSPARPAGALAPRVAQPLPRLVFALYRYDYQNDSRKDLPLLSVRKDDGASLLATHPMGGDGPWMTYDRVDWHREQLTQMRQAGIDVVLPVYRAGVADKQRYSQRGLTTLAGALRWLRQNNGDFPHVGLYLDTSSLTGPAGSRLDLSSAAGQSELYAAIEDFFLQMPPACRASVPLTDANGGGVADIVVLSSAAPFDGVSQAFVDYCRARFAADFGADLLILGGSDFQPAARLDGYVDDAAGRGLRIVEGGWVRTASVGVSDAGSAKGGSEGSLASRRDGDTYRTQWKQAVAKGAAWVFVDGWNDYADGAEIAPTDEFGVQYADLTRVFSRALAGAGAARASFLSHTIPAVALAGSTFAVSVRMLNAGATVWQPETTALAYRWKGTGADAALRTVPLPAAVLPGRTTSVTFALQIPSAAGRHEVEIDLAQIGKKGEAPTPFSTLGSAPLVMPVRAASQGDPDLPAYAASLVGTDLPNTVESGGLYTAEVTLRNEGSLPWRKADGARIIARLLRYTSPINANRERESTEVVAMADASAALLADVAPGQEVTASVPVAFADADGAPLPPWSPTDSWTYLLRWEVAPSDGATAGATTAPEAISLSEADIGARFTEDMTPRELPGDHRVPVKLGVANAGPQTWRKDVTRIGYHWYYLDGTEVIWQDETTGIPRDVAPGDQVTDMLVWVTAPPNDGTYWLVWDVRAGDTWESTLPSVRPFETVVHRVDVVQGRLTFVDLTRAYNLDGIADDGDPSGADFDGAGRSLPADLVPPFVTTDTAPNTLWLPATGVGPDSSRRLSFRWGPKGPGQRNVLQCVGQRVPVGDPRRLQPVRAVHLLAAATSSDAAGPFTLVFADGTQQFIQMPFSRWDQAPRYVEEIGYRCRRIRARSGDTAGQFANLYHYTIRIPEPKRVAAILLPNAPAIKIVAITLER